LPQFQFGGAQPSEPGVLILERRQRWYVDTVSLQEVEEWRVFACIARVSSAVDDEPESGGLLSKLFIVIVRRGTAGVGAVDFLPKMEQLVKEGAKGRPKRIRCCTAFVDGYLEVQPQRVTRGSKVSENPPAQAFDHDGGNGCLQFKP
jgi:hypothetical protein